RRTRRSLGGGALPDRVDQQRHRLAIHPPGVDDVLTAVDGDDEVSFDALNVDLPGASRDLHLVVHQRRLSILACAFHRPFEDGGAAPAPLADADVTGRSTAFKAAAIAATSCSSGAASANGVP